MPRAPPAPVEPAVRHMKSHTPSETRLPSSHGSPGSTTPFPHSEAPAWSETARSVVPPGDSVTEPAPLAVAVPLASRPSSATSTVPDRPRAIVSVNIVGNASAFAPAATCWGNRLIAAIDWLESVARSCATPVAPGSADTVTSTTLSASAQPARPPATPAAIATSPNVVARRVDRGHCQVVPWFPSGVPGTWVGLRVAAQTPTAPPISTTPSAAKNQPRL